MYIVVLNPKTQGKVVYDNTGKSARAVNYLEKEAKENGQEAVFFSRTDDDIKGSRAQEILDANVKGLGKNEEKFFSLLISPSAEELALIDNDPVKLRDFTRGVMQQYAENFTFKDGKKIQADDLVWTAAQHNERRHRGDGVAVQLEQARSGEPKEGLQTHIHVLVSARNAAQTTTLNPRSKAARFDRVEWAAKGAVLFTERYGAVELGHAAASVSAEKERIKAVRPPMSAEEQQRREDRVGERVRALNQILPAGDQLEATQVYGAGRARQYDRVFYKGLSCIEAAAQQGVPLAAPYQLLATGRQADPWSEQERERRRQERGSSGMAAGRSWQPPAAPLSQGLLRATNRDMGKAANRLADMNRGGYTQDISGDRDKDRGGVERE